MDKESFSHICGAKLDEVTLTCRSYTETAQLTYSYMCGNRMFLDTVKNREGKYSFQYKLDNGITPPTPLTYNIDHWGFWRGTRSNSGIIPKMKPGTSYDQDYSITSNDRDATGEYYDYTLLREMTYPTGGCTRLNMSRTDIPAFLSVYLPLTTMQGEDIRREYKTLWQAGPG